MLRNSSLWSVFAPGWDTQYKVLGKGIFSLEYQQNPTADQWTHQWPWVRSILYIFILLVITKKPTFPHSNCHLASNLSSLQLILYTSTQGIFLKPGSDYVTPPTHRLQSLWCCPLVYGTQTVHLALGLSMFNLFSQPPHYPPNLVILHSTKRIKHHRCAIHVSWIKMKGTWENRSTI